MSAVIFDLDGTLLDVREGFYWQFQELTRQFDGMPATKSQIDAAAHGTTEEIVRALVKNRQVSLGDLCRRHHELRVQSYDRHLKLYDGVADLLPLLRRLSMKVGALTSGNYLTVMCLDRTNIRQHFDTVIDASHVARHKPHPEGLHLALSKIGAHPSDAIMVGDTVADIMAGRNAGVRKTVGVSHGFGAAADLQAAGADHIIDDIPSLLDVLE